MILCMQDKSYFLIKLSKLMESTFDFVNPYIFKVVSFLMNLFKPGEERVLIYTDSRGYEVTKAYNRRNPMSSYVWKLMKDYRCDVFLCPEKSTSLIDFLYFWKRNEKKRKVKYRYVILHCGIVDFSPRPESSYESIIRSKMDKIQFLNLDSYFEKRTTGPLYENELTMSVATIELVENYYVPFLQKIDGLIYIGVNPVIPTWKGHYWRMRPENINEILRFDAIMCKEIANIIKLSNWNNSSIMSNTVDNVHYNRKGFGIIYRQIIQAMSFFK